MEDVTPELLRKVQEKFAAGIKNSEVIKRYNILIKNGEANYNEASKVAKEIGSILARTYQEIILSDALPDGRMYYNIAKRIVGTTLENGYETAADAAEAAQSILNKKASIGIKVIRPSLEKDRIDGFLNRLAAESNFNTVKWILNAPVVNFTMKAVDDSVKQNAEFHYESGLKPKITRKSSGHCCKWCSEVEGTYDYKDAPKDIYKRHDNCDCSVEYDPGSGKQMQDVWSKGWRYKAN